MFDIQTLCQYHRYAAHLGPIIPSLVRGAETKIDVRDDLIRALFISQDNLKFAGPAPIGSGLLSTEMGRIVATGKYSLT